jgi:5-methylcytosine-specific restriction protein A
MTGRAVEEWIGSSPDAKVPPRVRLRIFERHGGRCHISGRKIAAGEPWELDHVVALINGGEHRESNLAPALRDKHRAKTAVDVAEKSSVRQRALSHRGIRPKSKFPCSRDSKFKRTLDGRVVLR